MSRIRSVHPGLWTDEAFMGLSAHARLLIIGIWTEAFDDGVFDWKPLTLKARIFPADAVDMSALLGELADGDFIRREEVNGRKVGLIRNFREYQRPKKPNSSGALRAEWGTYVGISADGSEDVPHQFPTGSENAPQMEDGEGVGEGRKTRPPVSVAEGARDLFDEVWEAFPRNPTSNEGKAEAAFRATKASDHPVILAAAQRYSRWFTEDCERRKRTVDAGLSFVPHLVTWIETGAWKEAAALPIKAEKSAPVIAMTRIDRVLEPDVWAACERLQGKRAPTSDTAWSFPAEIVSRARGELRGQRSSSEVH